MPRGAKHSREGVYSARVSIAIAAMREFKLILQDWWWSYNSLDFLGQRYVGGALGCFILLTVLAWRAMLPFIAIVMLIVLCIRRSHRRDQHDLNSLKISNITQQYPVPPLVDPPGGE